MKSPKKKPTQKPETKTVPSPIASDPRGMEALLNSTDDMMWSVDRDLRLLAANETFFKSTEAFSGGRLKLGEPVLREDLFSPELIRGWKAWYQKVLAGEKIREEHHVPAGKNSPPYWWEIWLNPISEGSNIIGVACFGRTITQRKEMELALLKSQEVLESTIESPSEMIILSIDREFRYLSFNSYHHRATLEAYGIEIKKGMSLLDGIPVEAEREKARLCFERAFAGASFTSEERYGTHQPSFWETRYSPILDEHKKCVGATAISLNVTARKIAEEARQESEDRLRMIFRTLSEGVALNEIICDADGVMIDYKILEVNDAFYKVADYDKKVPVIGSLATQLYGMTRDSIRRFWDQHRGAAQTTHTEYLSPLSGRYFMISTSPFANHQFVTTFHDITARKKDEEQIRNLVYFDTLTQLPNRRLLL
ncbi:MAG: PAS domain-containing protein, partial [Spirochaetia bacterium]|nr:PAS domain-containing protein [Spirochaetia bacterium]